MSQLCHRQVTMMSPACLYEVGVEGGGQQENSKLQHTAQPEEYRTGNHGNDPAQYHVLHRGRIRSFYTAVSPAQNKHV